MPISCPASATAFISAGNVSIEWPGINHVVLMPSRPKQLQEARTADLPGEQPTRNIVRGILTAVGAEPAGDSINIDTKPAQDLLRHRPSPAWCARFVPPGRYEPRSARMRGR